MTSPTSPKRSTRSDATRRQEPPAWLADLLGRRPPSEGEALELRGERFRMHGGILRCERVLSAAQARTGASFAFKWAQRATYESEAALARTRAWLRERYGDPAAAAWWRELPPRPVLLDAGCGAALSAIELFGDVLDRVHYVGVDVSEAVEVAAARFGEAGWSGAFFQADLSALPLPAGSCDVIFAEGVLHHTDSTAAALKALAPLLSPRGRFLFYVYRRKGPIREFTDDYIRARLQGMSAEAAWQALLPLTKLGKALGDLDLTVEVPEAIGLLEIPAGRVPLQRLFYWHVFKAFHHPDLSLEELNHINFDWYAPANAHRQSPEEVRAWCAEASLEIEREVIEPAGITVIARRAA